MESEKKFSADEAHRYFGVEFNNRVFALGDKEQLTKEEALEIVNTAHASLLHWQKYSKYEKVNTQRGLYMITKAYVKVKNLDNAMHFGLLCIDFTREYKGEMQDFDLFYAKEIMARVYALKGDKTTFQRYYTAAKERLSEIKNPEDLKWAKKDFESGDWFGMA